MSEPVTFSTLNGMMQELMSSLENIKEEDLLKKQKLVENTLYKTFKSAPEDIHLDSREYYPFLSCYLYRYILKHYKHKEDKICLWRYFKNLSDDQLNHQNGQ